MRIQNVRVRFKGFTLIELMIVVAIIGIVAAFAYPQYTSYVLKAGRGEGSAALLSLMERQESYYRDNLTYTTNLTQLGYPDNTIDSESGRYQLSAATCTSGNQSLSRCVRLVATPQNAQANDPTGNLTLNSRGVKSANWSD